MKFLCGSCRTKYQISDGKVRGKVLTIRCKKCGAKIVVRESLVKASGGGTAVAPVAEEEKPVAAPGSGSARMGGSAALAAAFQFVPDTVESDEMPTSIEPVPPKLNESPVEWYVAIDGEQQGPFPMSEVVRRVRAGVLLGRHYVWHDGMENWERVRAVSQLASHIGAELAAPAPPPVRGGGAAVLDLREARQGRGAVSDNTLDDEAAEIDHTTLDQRAVAELQPSTSSDRAEQLENVLNEALGIQGEGKTLRAEPEGAVALLHTAASSIQVSDPSSRDALLSFASNEDIFASVPRAPDELGPRENTRFFVAAAGVNRQKSKNRIAIAVGGVLALGLIGFVGAWSAGVVQISVPGIGNPFAGGSDEALAEETYDGEAADPKALRAALAGERKSARRKGRRARPARRAAADGEYLDDGADTDEGGTRGTAGAEALKIDGALETGGAATDSAIGDAELPSADVSDVPLPDGTPLTQDAITRVINSRKKSVSICYEQSLRAREDLRGKLKFRVTVVPSGRVSRAVVETTAFKGSKLGRCIADKIKDWKFPTFTGEAQQVVVPFVLEKQSY